MADELDPSKIQDATSQVAADAAQENKEKTSQQMLSDMPDVFSTSDAAKTPDAAAQPAPDAAAPTVSPVIERLRSLGFQDVADEKQGTERLLTAFEQARQQQQALEDQINQIRQQNLLMQSQLAQQITQPGQTPGRQAPGAVPTPASVEPADPWPAFPQMDMGMWQTVQKWRTPEGEWKPGAPTDVMARATQWEAAINDWQAKLIMNPKEALQPIIDFEVKKALQEVMGGDPKQVFEQQFETRSKQEQQQAEVAQAWERVNPWMWQADPLTQQPSRNPTEFGARFQQSFRQEQERIKQLQPDIDDDSLFFHAMQGAYFRHEPEINYLEQQWAAYQAQQGNGQQQQQQVPAQTQPEQQQQVDPREKARQEFLERNRQNAQAGGQRAGALPEDSKGRKRGEKPQGAAAAGLEFVNSLASDGFFQSP